MHLERVIEDEAAARVPGQLQHLALAVCEQVDGGLTAHARDDEIAAELDPQRAIAHLGFFSGRFQPSSVTCFARVSVSLPSGASLVIVLPAPVVASLPMRTGATSMLPEPMNAPSSMVVVD